MLTFNFSIPLARSLWLFMVSYVAVRNTHTTTAALPFSNLYSTC